MRKKKIWFLVGAVAVLGAAVFAVSGYFIDEFEKKYADLLSPRVLDRNGELVLLRPNAKEQYSVPVEGLPDEFVALLLKKEDQWFYWHPGVNPWGIARGIVNTVRGEPRGSSTITEQLVKTVLGHENDRSLVNKLKELVYVFSLELRFIKEEILERYLNTAYFGNQIQGIELASQYYFDAKSESLSREQMLELLATIGSPSDVNPTKASIVDEAKKLARQLDVQIDESALAVAPKRPLGDVVSDTASFEIRDVDIGCVSLCELTIDRTLTEKIRAIAKKRADDLRQKNIRNAAVVVIDVRANELLALVGSVDPSSQSSGGQINMALEQRPIGSTIKPFLYAKGFEIGLRPYTLVDDREYRYSIADGFSFYPKNFDYQYHGRVTLEYALANSLNVPAVRVFEYIGTKEFQEFMEGGLGFEPVQPFDQYGLSIPLGGFEMSPLQLASYLTLFPRSGDLSPVRILADSPSTDAWLTLTNRHPASKQVVEKKYAGLLNRILSDRKLGVEQFGLVSSLNLPQKNYAVKTGTSQEFRDSWVVGWTPDFLVAVWMGNADNTPTDEVSGQRGAGAIWHDVMELLMNSEYDRDTPFDFSETKDILVDGALSFGLPDDVIEDHRNLLLSDSLILSPHDGDVMLGEAGAEIVFKASADVVWLLDGAGVGEGSDITSALPPPGWHTVTAIAAGGREETVAFFVTEQ